MVFEPNFSKVISSVRKKLGNAQSSIEVRLPANENNINEIYSVDAVSIILTTEAVGNEINYTGVVSFKVIVGNGEISVLDYSAEFKDKFVAGKDVTGEVVVRCTTVDSGATASADGVRVNAVVEVEFDEIISEERNVLTSVNADDAHLSTKQIEYTTYSGKAVEKFDTDTDLELLGAVRLLSVIPCANISNIDIRDNYLVVNGNINFHICYMDGMENNSLRTHEHSNDFSYEVAFNGLDENSIVQSTLNLLMNEMQVSTTDIEGGLSIGINLPITYTGYVFESNNLDIVDDIYLEGNYLSITSENADTLRENPSVNFRDNISGTVSVSETAPFIDEVLGVCASNIMVANINTFDDRLTIEGVTSATVMYYTKETSDITSIQVEMPFVIEEKIEGENPELVTICLSNINARSKRGKEIEVSAEISAYVDMYSVETFNVISDITLGDEKPEEDCSLFIYIVKKGQTLWDVAKETNVSQELIIEQNPELELPISAGDKVVIYKPKIMEF